jgi:lipoprotein-anchoring transpeptidase ErfK/SrfK
MPGHATPTGRYEIVNTAVDPAWTAPDKPWAGAYRNEVVTGGSPENPLKARWLGIVDGVGIHGTDATWSLGTRASHGCIRMSVPVVKRLYERVPVGTLVMIK